MNTKKVLTVSLIAMFAVGAARADIASTGYVNAAIERDVGDVSKLNTENKTVVPAINELKLEINALTGDETGSGSLAKQIADAVEEGVKDKQDKSTAVTRTAGTGAGSETMPVYVKSDGTVAAITSFDGNAASATLADKATKDGDGNVITTTYYKQSDANTLSGNVAQNTSDISGLKAKVGETSVAEQITAAIADKQGELIVGDNIIQGDGVKLTQDETTKAITISADTYDLQAATTTALGGIMATDDINVAADGAATIGAGAVTAAKLATDAVTTLKIADGAVTDDKITDVAMAKVTGLDTAMNKKLTIPEKPAKCQADGAQCLLMAAGDGYTWELVKDSL